MRSLNVVLFRSPRGIVAGEFGVGNQKPRQRVNSAGTRIRPSRAVLWLAGHERSQDGWIDSRTVLANTRSKNRWLVPRERKPCRRYRDDDGDVGGLKKNRNQKREGEKKKARRLSLSFSATRSPIF